MRSFVYIIFALLLFFTSCNEKSVLFKVTNNSEKKIDSLIISNGYDTVKIEVLKSNQTKKTYLYFTNNKNKSDGSFLIKTYPKNKKRNFGYFTNGIVPKYNYFLLIEKDTLIIKEFTE